MLPQAQGGKFWAEGWRVSVDAPASHTLSVWSSEPETMVLPSGEKATEFT